MINVDQCITDLARAAETADFLVSTYGIVDGSRLLGLTRSATAHTESRRTIYLSAGIHGDEPAGPVALLSLLQTDALPRHHNWVICPLMNPSGLKKGSRENQLGIDLNRDYRDFRSVESCRHRDFLSHYLASIDLGIHLHEDWEFRGFYLYELNFGKHPSRAKAILRAASHYLPIETAECIDGRTARSGIIRPKTLPDLPEGCPESIWLYQEYGGVFYTLETPSTANLALRADALKGAVLAVAG
jgi:hypothetical protein